MVDTIMLKAYIYNHTYHHPPIPWHPPTAAEIILHTLNWIMQHLFRVHIVKLRFNKWREYRGRQPAGPAGVGARLVVWRDA